MELFSLTFPSATFFWVTRETRRTAIPANAEQGKIQLSDGNLGKSLIEKAKCYCVIIVKRDKNFGRFWAYQFAEGQATSVLHLRGKPLKTIPSFIYNYSVMGRSRISAAGRDWLGEVWGGGEKKKKDSCGG